MNLARRFVGARDGDLIRRRRRHHRQYTPARGDEVVALLLDASEEELHVGTIAGDIVEAVDDVTGADFAGIAVSGEDDADGDVEVLRS